RYSCVSTKKEIRSLAHGGTAKTHKSSHMVTEERSLILIRVSWFEHSIIAVWDWLLSRTLLAGMRLVTVFLSAKMGLLSGRLIMTPLQLFTSHLVCQAARA